MNVDAVTSHRQCPACGSAVGGHLVMDLRLRTPDGHPLQGGYPVVSCSACGCGFADVVIPGAYYENYYANLAKYATESEHQPDGPEKSEPSWLVEKAESTARRVGGLLVSKEARILDVGCATGSLLGALGRLGYVDLHGVDPAPEAVRQATSRQGVRARVGSFTSLPDDLGSFDCICLTGVLEHLWDVEGALRAIQPLLRPRGIVYLEVPDASRYLDPYVAPFEDFSTEHVNHFSSMCLRVLASRLGFAPIYDGAIEEPLAPGVPTALVAVAWTTGDHKPHPTRRDDNLRAVLCRYADRSSNDVAGIAEQLRHGLGKADQFILWGIGETAFKLLALPELAQREASCYVDSNPARRAFRFGGMPVVTPEEIMSSDIAIVASSLIRADSIVAAASRLGLANPVLRIDSWQRASPAPR